MLNIYVLYFFVGLIPAVAHQFPNSQHKGCLFHHTQAIWRHVQTLCLQQEYETDPAVRR